MDINKLKSFVVVAEKRSMSQTGLLLDPSVISRHINELEKYYNVKLFVRKPKCLELTAEGELLLQKAKQLVDEFEALKHVLSDQSEQEVKGSLTVYTPTTWASIFLLEYIADFKKEFPKITLNIISDDEDPDFEKDMQTVALLPYLPKRNGLVRKHLMSINLGLFAHETYLKQYGTPQSIEDLDQHRLIASSARNKNFTELDWHLVLGKKGRDARNPDLRVNNQFYAAQKGLGIASLAIENQLLVMSPLVNVLPEVKGPVIPAYLIYPEYLRHSKVVRVFSDFIYELMNKTWNIV